MFLFALEIKYIKPNKWTSINNCVVWQNTQYNGKTGEWTCFHLQWFNATFMEIWLICFSCSNVWILIMFSSMVLPLFCSAIRHQIFQIWYDNFSTLLLFYVFSLCLVLTNDQYFLLLLVSLLKPFLEYMYLYLWSLSFISCSDLCWNFSIKVWELKINELNS